MKGPVMTLTRRSAASTRLSARKNRDKSVQSVLLDILPALIGLQPTAAIVVLTGQGDETIAVELMKAYPVNRREFLVERDVRR